MRLISQQEALGVGELGAGEAARLWREPRHDGLDCLAARFRTHRYSTHTHETYVIGVITAGCEGFWLRGETRYAAAGELCFVNPGEAHDGAPVGEGFAYRMTYPSTALLRDLVEDLTGAAPCAAPFFREPVMRDAQAAQLFVAAHRGLERGNSALRNDEELVRAYGLLLVRYSDLGRSPRPVGGERRAVGYACDYLDAHFADEVDLATLARVAGLGRASLIRAFRRETGLTPHAWLSDRRIHAAQILLRQRTNLAEAAAATDFFDQAHFTRAFKARLGVTPGAYARAGRGPSWIERDSAG